MMDRQSATKQLPSTSCERFHRNIGQKFSAEFIIIITQLLSSLLWSSIKCASSVKHCSSITNLVFHLQPSFHNQVAKHGVWKSQKKSHSTLRAKRATFTFWVDKSELKMPKMVHFDEFLKSWSFRSNSVTRQVSFYRTKIGGKCQNSKN